ncbi:hypothetical protein JCM16303_002366 [Sporobolomyces ruberrimus]
MSNSLDPSTGLPIGDQQPSQPLVPDQVPPPTVTGTSAAPPTGGLHPMDLSDNNYPTGTSMHDPCLTQPAPSHPVLPPSVSLDDLVRVLQSLSRPSSTPSAPRAKLNDPLKFSGRVKDSSHFIYAVLANLRQAEAQYSTDISRITYLSTWLEGSALQWFLGLLRRNAHDYLARENATQVNLGQDLLVFDTNFQFDSTLYPFVLNELLSFDTFLRFFNLSFANPDARSTAKTKLANLKQTTSVAVFASEFQSYCFDLDDTPWRIAEKFYKNLKPAVKDKVHARGKPDNLTDMIALAISVDNRIQEREAERREEERLQRPARPTYAPAVKVSVAPNPTRAPITTRIAATSNPPSRISSTAPSSSRPASSYTRLSEADRQYRMDNRLCLYCGEPGHQKLQCPSRPALPSSVSAVSPSVTFDLSDSRPPSLVDDDQGKA